MQLPKNCFGIPPAATAEEINKNIRDLNPRKATGLDKILLKIVKNTANLIDYKIR